MVHFLLQNPVSSEKIKKKIVTTAVNAAEANIDESIM